MGAGIGAAAGAAAGLLGVLLSRGPEVVLARGTTLEMVLDRPVSFSEEDLENLTIPARRPQSSSGPAAQPADKGRESIPIPGRHTGIDRWPY